MSEQLQIASPQSWAAWASGTIKKLPSSGFPVRIVPVDVIDMMLEDGDVYDMFAAMQGNGETIDEDSFEAMVKNYPALKPFLEKLTLAAIGEPKVVRENPKLDAGEILLKWVATADRLFLFQEVFGEAQSLAAIFPAKQSGSVPASPGSEDLRAAAQQLGGVIGES